LRALAHLGVEASPFILFRVLFLGAVLLDSDGASEWVDRLDWNDFHLPFHQVIFRTLKKLKAEGKPTNDLVVLHDHLRAAGEFEAAGGAYISTLSEGLPRVANLANYAEIIHTKARARRLISQFDLNIDRLLSANGDLGDVVREIDSAHIGEGFGQKQSSNLFRTAADLVEESNIAAFVVKPYVLAGTACKHPTVSARSAQQRHQPARASRFVRTRITALQRQAAQAGRR
jgi:hypothetical protein